MRPLALIILAVCCAGSALGAAEQFEPQLVSVTVTVPFVAPKSYRADYAITNGRSGGGGGGELSLPDTAKLIALVNELHHEAFTAPIDRRVSFGTFVSVRYELGGRAITVEARVDDVEHGLSAILDRIATLTVPEYAHPHP
jgi:hypothetical protein